MSEAVERKLAAFHKKCVQEALQGKPYSPRTSEEVPVPVKAPVVRLVVEEPVIVAAPVAEGAPMPVRKKK